MIGRLLKGMLVRINENKSVFLTGAEGFIGSHMVESLVKKISM